MPEVKIDRERCKGCELCIINCPKKILVISEKINSRGYHFPELTDGDQCTGCAICARMCPDVAIEVYK